MTRRQMIAVMFGAALTALKQGAVRAESGVILLMVEEPGCPYCAMWHREVGKAYSNSSEGRFAPLIRRMKGHPDLSTLKGLNYSPIFIVMRGTEEIGRIIGYPGADFFWGLLDELLVKAGYQPDAAAPKG